jgi:hypothetical protein
VVFPQHQHGSGLRRDPRQLRIDDSQIDYFDQGFGSKLSAA